MFNLVQVLGDKIDFRIITSDRDFGDDKPLKGVRPGTWTRLGNAQVLYLSPRGIRPLPMFRILASETADYLYLNSFFSRGFSMLPILVRAAGAHAQKRIILAPSGEFSPGALALKPRRKRLYIGLAKRLPQFREVTWHATTELEAQDIRREFGLSAKVQVALPFTQASMTLHTREGSARTKTPGSLRIIFLSRISPKKNLLEAIRILRCISGQIVFNIYGNVEDTAYWHECEVEIRNLPANVSVEFRSMADSAFRVFSEHHIFLFPTLGENYGNVVFEALSAGCLPLISDCTPWRGLEGHGAGWDLPLGQPQLFRAALEKCVTMTNEQFQIASARARTYLNQFVSQRDPVAANLAMFRPCP